MRVFVTGATGFIGSAVVQELLGAGHEVLGLARSDSSAERLTSLGVAVHRGELADTQSLAAGARACDGVIHTAFIHDFSQYEANGETDRVALEAMASALEGTGKPLVSTSGLTADTPGRASTERDGPDLNGLGRVRAKSEEVLAAASRGVRASVIRLPPTVHGRGDQGFMPQLIETARRTGVAAYVGDGANRWPAVHRLDAARLFRLACETAAPGTRLHGVGEEGVPMRAIAEVMGAGLGVPVRSLTAEEAMAHFGFLGMFVGRDFPASSALTREMMGWRPRAPDLLDDLREGGYFS
ncbi:SDR family oxidoreductase [Phenylobacterium aquaticum]|uniref:SDR family oxidoreductase n=1 Tax=Phenylobacterium aquaticum TaxID=1763816 RepID=UPI0026E989D1|nr:SDR family oxidoreductase [Phenylobacterium aquaticum]